MDETPPSYGQGLAIKTAAFYNSLETLQHQLVTMETWGLKIPIINLSIDWIYLYAEILFDLSLQVVLNGDINN